MCDEVQPEQTNGTAPKPGNIDMPGDQLPLMMVRVVGRTEVVNERHMIIAIYTCTLVNPEDGRTFSEATSPEPTPLTFPIMVDTGRRTLAQRPPRPWRT